jgi:hypothetical protein
LRTLFAALTNPVNEAVLIAKLDPSILLGDGALMFA